MTMADLLAQLRAAVAEFGGDTEVSKLTLDLDRDAGEVETGYWSQVPNPARGGKSPPLYARIDEGGIGFEYAAEDDGKPDIHRQEQQKLYSRLKRERREGRGVVVPKPLTTDDND